MFESSTLLSTYVNFDFKILSSVSVSFLSELFDIGQYLFDVKSENTQI